MYKFDTSSVLPHTEKKQQKNIYKQTRLSLIISLKQPSVMFELWDKKSFFVHV